MEDVERREITRRDIVSDDTSEKTAMTNVV
jgi:hypothetical protein